MNKSDYKFGSTKNPYGLKENRLVYVDEVENGLKCGCVCPTCKCDLIAKQGDEREHHFAHRHDDKSCLHIRDTYFRRTIEILETNGYITLPKFGEIDAKKATIKKVWTEKVMDSSSFLPDIVAETEDGMAIHIRFSRIKNSEQIKYNREIVCLELNAEKIKLEDLENFLLYSEQNKIWVSNPVYKEVINKKALKKRKEYQKRYEAQQLYMRNCKIKDSFAFDESINDAYLSRTQNNYLERGTEQQRDIKKMLRDNEYIGKSISYCEQCANHGTNCNYLKLNFIEKDKEYIICSNPDKFKIEFFKGKYFDFKPLPQYDPIEQYEAKIWIDKHFTQTTTIMDFAKVNNHIVVMHTDGKIFYVTNVSYINNSFHFSHEKTFQDRWKAVKYYIWLKEI